MIEDPEALGDLQSIIRTPGLDGVFIGRGDLTVAFGAPDPNAPAVRSAVHAICAAAREANKPVWVMVGSGAEAEEFKKLGASVFIVGSDQAFLRMAAAGALAGFKNEQTVADPV
jgi:2-keto-3-deoxy-L-rhamnonate aldolase RhmA